MAANTIHPPQPGEVSALGARMKLAKAVNYIGMAMAMLKQGEMYARAAVVDVDAVYEDARAKCAPFDPGMGDQAFAELAYLGEYARIVQALNQLECASHDAIELGGMIAQFTERCSAMPDDGTKAYLRLAGRATMDDIRGGF